MHQALKIVHHRPWPLPSGPWIMEQTWNDLLFAHWPVAADSLRPLIPSFLPLDTFDGQCWIAVTPFHMTGVRGRWMPPIPTTSRFPELNVRTYVTFCGKPGVFFFSLDAASRLAVWGARAAYHLPYFYARMKVRLEMPAFTMNRFGIKIPNFEERTIQSVPCTCASQEHSSIGSRNVIASTLSSAVRFFVLKSITNHGRYRMLKQKLWQTRWPARQEFGCPKFLRYSILQRGSKC